MARSHYIYILSFVYDVVGVFTVKHEALSAIKRDLNSDITEDNLTLYNLVRWPDGRIVDDSQDVVIIDLKKELLGD